LTSGSSYTPPPAFGRLKVLHQIGAGVLGPVFRAHEDGGERLLAVKALTLDLTPEQAAAVDRLSAHIDGAAFHVALLHGVTGSGKTEVYLRALAETLSVGGSAIFLVPEIALTPQLLSRIGGRFKDDGIAVLHSGISKAVRYDQWRNIGRGGTRIIVGARSAVFAPARNLKLIIVDEEHDASYKQDERMRYNARDLAIVKARFHGATVVLGSATPSLESWNNALGGKYVLARLPERVESRPLPAVVCVNMSEERKAGNLSSLSVRLREELASRAASGEKSIVLISYHIKQRI